MARQRGLEREGPRLLVRPRFHVLHLPDLGCMVCAACCQLLDVWREEDTSDVLLVSVELRHGEQLGPVVGLHKTPDKYVALRIMLGRVSLTDRHRRGEKGKVAPGCLLHRAATRRLRPLR